MHVLAAVHPELAGRLQKSASHRFAVVPAETWSSAVAIIRRQPIEIAVVDPALEGAPRAQEIERLHVLFPSLPLVLYARLTPDLPAVLLQLGRSGVRTVVLAGHDDHPTQIRDVLTEEGARSLSRRLLDEVSDLLDGLPAELRWAIETIVRAPAQFHTVQELADRARMDRRTCARWFARVALPPPSVMLTLLRVVYAHRLLQDPGYTVEDVAARLGYARARSFTQNVKEVFGMTPAELRMSLASEEALALVRERFFEGHPERARRVGSGRVSVDRRDEVA